MKYSNPEKLRDAGLKIVCETPTNLKLFINDICVMDYNGTDTMHDEWHTFHYDGESYDMHIYFSEAVCEYITKEEWGELNHVAFYSISEVDTDGYCETNHSDFITVDIDFKFDIHKWQAENFVN